MYGQPGGCDRPSYGHDDRRFGFTGHALAPGPAPAGDPRFLHKKLGRNAKSGRQNSADHLTASRPMPPNKQHTAGDDQARQSSAFDWAGHTTDVHETCSGYILLKPEKGTGAIGQAARKVNVAIE